MGDPRRKKVLILTYYWPPSGGAGVQRWLKFTKYLRDFNYEPVIYTAEDPEYPSIDESLYRDVPDELTILKTRVWEPYKIYKWFTFQKKGHRINTGFLNTDKKKGLSEKISVWIRGNWFIPDARKFWIKPSIRFLVSYINAHPIDLIISTGPPHSLHIIAMKVAGKSGLPWVADFRDPWTKIDFYQDLMLSPSANKKHHKLEREVLQAATAITVVSNHMKKQFEEMGANNIRVIPNGFDQEDFTAEDIHTDRVFSLTHIGTIVPTRNPETLWKVIAEIVKERKDIAEDLEVKLVGARDYSVTRSIEDYIIGKWVKTIEYLPHQEAISILQRSTVLLLLINNTPDAKGILTGKFFEYLGSGRPMFVIGPTDGEAARILSETGTGYIADFDDHESIKRKILELYGKYKNNELSVAPENIIRYSRKNLTNDLANLLTEILKDA